MDRFKTPARGLLAAAIAVSFAFAWMTPAVEAPDSGGYLNPARSWAAGNGLREGDGSPLSYRMPVYPMALGTTFRLFGDSPRTTTMLNFALLLAAALLMRDVTRRQGGRPPGDVVAAVTLLYPPFLTSTALVLQEVLLAFQVALLFWLLLRAVDKPVPWTALAAGLAFAFAALGKPTILMAAPFLLIAFTTGPLKLRRGAAFIVGAALLLGAWGLRNAVELGRFELAPGNAGHTFLGGTVANDIDGWFTFPEYTAAVDDWNRLPVSERTTLDRFLGQRALARVMDDPLHWVDLCAERAARFMLPARTWFFLTGLSQTGSFSLIYRFATAVNVLLFLLAAALAWTAWAKRDVRLALGPLLIFTHMLVYAITYVSPRYAVTVGPVLIASAALAVQERRRSRV